MRISYYAATFLIRNLARLIFRLKIIGKENIPPGGPFILACNHISYYDPPLIGSSFKREIHFLAKKELFRNRIFGGLIRHFNAHPINRNGIDKSAIETVSKVLNSGQAIMIFPEGTRARGVEFLSPRPGIGMIALNNKVPVIPAYINGANDLLGSFIGRNRLGVIFGPPMNQSELGAYAKDKDGYRKFAEDSMGRIRMLKEEFNQKAVLSKKMKKSDLSSR